MSGVPKYITYTTRRIPKLMGGLHTHSLYSSFNICFPILILQNNKNKNRKIITSFIYSAVNAVNVEIEKKEMYKPPLFILPISSMKSLFIRSFFHLEK